DHVHRLCDAFSALWHALQFGLDAADSQGARGVGSDEWRLLEHDLSSRRSAVVEAWPAGWVDLRDDRLDPGAVELDPALLPRHRSGIDHDMGAVAEWAVCGAFGARRHADRRAVPDGHAGAARRQAVRNCGNIKKRGMETCSA